MTDSNAQNMHTARAFMICLPFLFVLAFYPLVYIFLVRRYSPTKLAMVRKFQVSNKIIAVVITLLLIPPMIYGTFYQTYLRIAITLACIALTFFSEEHFMIRLVAVLMHFVVIIILEYFYWRELTMQVGCYGQGSCAGATDFQNLSPLKSIGIGNGLLLNNAYISFGWASGLYARAIIVIALHYYAVLNILVQCVWIGFFSNIKIERKLEVIRDRPDEDIVSIFTTFKQSSFFRMYEKLKEKKSTDGKAKTCC